jgi:hypothetical protein
LKTLVHDGMDAEQALLVGMVEAHIEQSKNKTLQALLSDAQIEIARLQEIATRNINRVAHLERELREEDE